MPPNSTPFHHRLLGRMLLLVVLPTAIILALVVALAVRRGFSNLRSASEQFLQAEAALAAWQIESENEDAVRTANLMADAQVAGMFGDRRASMALARDVLEHSPHFTAAYIGYEPDADGKDQASIGQLPAEAMNESGRFIPYWFMDQARGNRISLEPMVDMESSLYYQGVKDAFAATGQARPMITEPYVYQGKMIVEQTYPIVIDGRFAGVAGVDRALSDVEQELRQLAARLEADAFLISSRGHFIAATTDPQGAAAESTGDRLKTRAVSETAYAELMGRLTSTGSSRTLTIEEDPIDGGRYYFAAVTIPTGGWTLIVRKAEAAILAPIWQQLRFGVIIVVLGLAVIVALLILSILQVSRRVNAAVTAANRIAAGDLTQEVETTHGRDETGDLLRAIGTMNGNLNRLVGDVKQAGIQMHSTATQLAATSREQESVANTFGTSANQIAAAVKEISATSGELLGTMNEVGEVAGGTAEVATAGQTGLEDMETTMRGLDEATGAIAGKLAVINEKAASINTVVTTITKVADQTNLLSVNAAIEAEKAGEYGVGFLVVAREIRRLADQTASATLNIERTVQEMQSAVSAGVMEMDRFADQVRRSVSNVSDIGHQMGQIIERVNANVTSFERVNEGMNSQSEGAEQISQAMGQLTAGAAQTMEATGEYARAADDLQSAIASLKSSIASFQLKS
jgi:methyl-accepting chemotaxis protein